MRKLAMGVCVLLLSTFGVTAQTAITADGVVESTSGGFKFPDGTVQTTAASPGTAPVEDTGQQGCWDASGRIGTASCLRWRSRRFQIF